MGLSGVGHPPYIRGHPSTQLALGLPVLLTFNKILHKFIQLLKVPKGGMSIILSLQTTIVVTKQVLNFRLASSRRYRVGEACVMGPIYVGKTYPCMDLSFSLCVIVSV